MKFHARFATFVVSGLLVGASFGPASAADTSSESGPSTADVLGKLHSTNVKQYRMAKLALEHGRSKDVQTFADVTIEDHDAADAQVADLAKEEGITLAAHTPAVTMERLPKGAGFDAAFARAELKEHERAVVTLRATRDATRDPKLKALLDGLLPMLVKHAAMAQSLVEQEPGKT